MILRGLWLLVRNRWLLRCTNRGRVSDSHSGNLKVRSTYFWHTLWGIDASYIILPSSMFLIWFCLKVRTFLRRYEICPQTVSPKCSIGDVSKINVGGFRGKDNYC